MPENLPPIVAAITPRHGDADRFVSALASSLTLQGWRVRGLVQEKSARDGVCRYALIDLENRHAYPISQQLGAHSQSCTLDPQAMADASGVLRRIAAEGADLALVNRFGKQEAGGRGFAAEMLDIMSRGIPLLTVVHDEQLPAWREFTGGLAAELPDTAAAVIDWLAASGRTRPAEKFHPETFPAHRPAPR